MHASAAPAVPAASASVTEPFAPLATLPPASRRETRGCWVQAAVAVPPPGWLENAIETAGPGVTSNAALVPAARPVAVAVSV